MTDAAATRTETGAAPMVYSIEINAPIQTVWREITKTDEPQAAMFNAQMFAPTLAPGAPIRMRTKSGKYTSVVGDVIEFDPPRRLSHSFRFTAYDDPECTVVYDLEELSPTATRFTLTVENAAPGTKTTKNMARGGNFICKTLKAACEKGRPPLTTRLIYLVFRVLEPTSPKKCRTENWQ